MKKKNVYDEVRWCVMQTRRRVCWKN